MLNLQETHGEQSPMHYENRCPMCADPTILQVIWVHGHGQCANCGINIEPCCAGAPLDQTQLIQDFEE